MTIDEYRAEIIHPTFYLNVNFNVHLDTIYRRFSLRKVFSIRALELRLT